MSVNILTNKQQAEPIPAVIENDGRIKLVNLSDLQYIKAGENVTLNVTFSEELVLPQDISEPALAEFWQDEPDWSPEIATQANDNGQQGIL